MATHSSILAWRIQRSLSGYSPWGRTELDMTEQVCTQALEVLASAKTLFPIRVTSTGTGS